MSAEYESVALSEAHDVADFDCGVPSLNEWLASQALRAQRAGTARTFVWTKPGASQKTWAYYSLAPTQVARDSLTRSQSSGYSIVPGYLIGRLAVHRDLHGLGYGGQVLVDALTRAFAAADTGGGRLVGVDAISDAAISFYRHHGFAPVRENPRRLVLKMATIRALLDQ